MAPLPRVVTKNPDCDDRSGKMPTDDARIRAKSTVRCSQRASVVFARDAICAA
jgi:hypothetical protein